MKHSFTASQPQGHARKLSIAEEEEEECSKKMEGAQRRQRVFSYDDAIQAARMLISAEDAKQSLGQCCLGPNNNNNTNFHPINNIRDERPWETVLGDKPRMLEMHAF